MRHDKHWHFYVIKSWFSDIFNSFIQFFPLFWADNRALNCALFMLYLHIYEKDFHHTEYKCNIKISIFICFFRLQDEWEIFLAASWDNNSIEDKKDIFSKNKHAIYLNYNNLIKHWTQIEIKRKCIEKVMKICHDFRDVKFPHCICSPLSLLRFFNDILGS